MIRRFWFALLVVVLILVGVDEYCHRQLLGVPVRRSSPVRQIQQRVPHLKAPGDASRESKKVVTKGPIRYHGFFNSKNQAAYLATVRKTALADVNRERAKRHLQPLRLDRSLNQVATLRSIQADRNFNHYNRSGQVLACLDAVRTHFMPSYQQARSHLSECLSEQAGNVDNTASQVSQTAVHGMIYHDAQSRWGHRKILLDRKNRYIGITAHFNKKKDNKVVVAYELYQ